jgi:hypothetical protein
LSPEEFKKFATKKIGTLLFSGKPITEQLTIKCIPLERKGFSVASPCYG